MQNRRNSNEMDLSGRSMGSGMGLPAQPGFPMPQMMAPDQQRYAQGYAPQQFGNNPQSSSQHQRYMQQLQQQQQMQYQQQHRHQQQQHAPPQQMRQPPPLQHHAHPRPKQYHQNISSSQKSQRRGSHGSIGSIQSVPRQTVPKKLTQSKLTSSESITTSSNGTTSTTSASPVASKGASKPKSSRSAPPSQPSYKETEKLLKQSDWVDRTLWMSKQIFGGQATNGFLRSTATVQRVKKQRARQTASKAGADRSKVDGSQAGEEILKKEVMNARTAKKIKTEMEAGMQYCELVHRAIHSILTDLKPSVPLPPTLDRGLPDPNAFKMPPKRKVVARPAPAPFKLPAAPPVETVSPGDPNGSTLRKLRKKKLPPNDEEVIKLSEYEEGGKKRYSKKEQLHRITEATRFRELRPGDFVAARRSSRDLWILARVLEPYASFRIAPTEFLKLSGAKRDSLFKDKVSIKDADDSQPDGSIQLARHLVLPLPRSFSEAAAWGTRAKKGTRVYAMYPMTTALYPATVIDNTTYCRDSDDIIVVEFDDDEPDPNGKIPHCHIPARFVTIIPRQLVPSPVSNQKKRKTSDTNGSAYDAAATDNMSTNAMLDEIDFDAALPNFEDFDDLDFDLLGGG